MRLEKLLSPFIKIKEDTWDKVDETLHKYYTRQAIRKETPTELQSIKKAQSSVYFTMGGAAFAPGDSLFLAINSGASIILNSYNAITMRSQVEHEINNPKIKNIKVEKNKVNKKNMRVPIFLYGLTNYGLALYEMYKYHSGEHSNLSIIPKLILDGTAYVKLAQSLYLQDSDPKILEKQPMWQAAVEDVQQKTKQLVYKPQPVKITNE